MGLFDFWKAAKEQERKEKEISAFAKRIFSQDVRMLTDRQRLVLASWVVAGVCSPDGSFGTFKEVLTRKDDEWRGSWITEDGDCFSAWEVVLGLVKMGILKRERGNMLTLLNTRLAIECYDYPGRNSYSKKEPPVCGYDLITHEQLLDLCPKGGILEKAFLDTGAGDR